MAVNGGEGIDIGFVISRIITGIRIVRSNSECYAGCFQPTSCVSPGWRENFSPAPSKKQEKL